MTKLCLVFGHTLGTVLGTRLGVRLGMLLEKNDGHKARDGAYGPNWPSRVPCRAERWGILTLESERKDSAG